MSFAGSGRLGVAAAPDTFDIAPLAASRNSAGTATPSIRPQVPENRIRWAMLPNPPASFIPGRPVMAVEFPADTTRDQIETLMSVLMEAMKLRVGSDVRVEVVNRSRMSIVSDERQMPTGKTITIRVTDPRLCNRG